VIPSARSLLLRVGPSVWVVALSGCSLFAPKPPPPPPPPPTVSIARLYEQPAERDLINGLRFYEDGQYERSETVLRRALAEGLGDPHDIAITQKYLAFIACAYNRPSDCEQAFRAAFAADPSFSLDETELGHPLWGPVYKRVAAEQPRPPPAPAPASATAPIPK